MYELLLFLEIIVTMKCDVLHTGFTEVKQHSAESETGNGWMAIDHHTQSPCWQWVRARGGGLRPADAPLGNMEWRASSPREGRLDVVFFDDQSLRAGTGVPLRSSGLGQRLVIILSSRWISFIDTIRPDCHRLRGQNRATFNTTNQHPHGPSKPKRMFYARVWLGVGAEVYAGTTYSNT